MPSLYSYFDLYLDNFQGIKKDSYLKFKELNGLLEKKIHLIPNQRHALVQLSYEINSSVWRPPAAGPRADAPHLHGRFAPQSAFERAKRANSSVWRPPAAGPRAAAPHLHGRLA